MKCSALQTLLVSAFFVDSADDDDFLGDTNAPVTIIEFSDYECPFCGRFYTDALQQIKEKYELTF